MTKRMSDRQYSDKRDRIDSSSPMSRQLSNAFLLQKMSGSTASPTQMPGINSSILPLVKELSSQIEAAENGSLETSTKGEMLNDAASQEKKTKPPANAPSDLEQGGSQSVDPSVEVGTSESGSEVGAGRCLLLRLDKRRDRHKQVEVM